MTNTQIARKLEEMGYDFDRALELCDASRTTEEEENTVELTVEDVKFALDCENEND